MQLEVTPGEAGIDDVVLVLASDDRGVRRGQRDRRSLLRLQRK